MIALVKALETENDVARGLAAYQAARRPIVETRVAAARRSADFPAHMRLDPRDFACSYITRSGRIDDERLREMSPAFMARYETARITKMSDRNCMIARPVHATDGESHANDPG